MHMFSFWPCRVGMNHSKCWQHQQVLKFLFENIDGGKEKSKKSRCFVDSAYQVQCNHLFPFSPVFLSSEFSVLTQALE